MVLTTRKITLITKVMTRKKQFFDNTFLTIINNENFDKKQQPYQQIDKQRKRQIKKQKAS